MNALYCVKGACIRSYFWSVFSTFGLNTEKYSVSLRIQSKWGKIRTRKTPNKDTFHAVLATVDVWVTIEVFKKLFPSKYKKIILITFRGLNNYIAVAWIYQISEAFLNLLMDSDLGISYRNSYREFLSHVSNNYFLLFLLTHWVCLICSMKLKFSCWSFMQKASP